MGGLTCPDTCHQRLGIGLPGKLDELGSEVFLKGPSGQGGAGSQFVAGFLWDIPDCNRHAHSIIMLLMLLLCNVATIRATLTAARPALQRSGVVSVLRRAFDRRRGRGGAFSLRWVPPGLFPRLGDDGCQIHGQHLAPVESALLDSCRRRSGLVQVGFRRGGDQVAEVGEVLVTACQSLERDEVPYRRNWHEDIGQHFQHLSPTDDLLLDAGVREEQVDERARRARLRPYQPRCRQPVDVVLLNEVAHAVMVSARRRIWLISAAASRRCARSGDSATMRSQARSRAASSGQRATATQLNQCSTKYRAGSKL